MIDYLLLMQGQNNMMQIDKISKIFFRKLAKRLKMYNYFQFNAILKSIFYELEADKRVQYSGGQFRLNLFNKCVYIII